MKMEDRLTELLAAKSKTVDCCFNCQYFTLDDDPLDSTHSFGYCNEIDDDVFGFQYCKKFKGISNEK